MSLQNSRKNNHRKKDLQTWEVVLRCIGAVAGFVLLTWLVLWLIAEFVFPAILFGLIFLSFFYLPRNSLPAKWNKKFF